MKDLNKLAELAQKCYDLEQTKKALTDQIKTVKNELERHLPYKETVKINDFSLRRTSHKSSRFDGTRFKKDHPKLYSEYLNESYYDKVIVNKSKKKDKK